MVNIFILLIIFEFCVIFQYLGSSTLGHIVDELIKEKEVDDVSGHCRELVERNKNISLIEDLEQSVDAEISG